MTTPVDRTLFNLSTSDIRFFANLNLAQEYIYYGRNREGQFSWIATRIDDYQPYPDDVISTMDVAERLRNYNWLQFAQSHQNSIEHEAYDNVCRIAVRALEQGDRTLWDEISHNEINPNQFR